MIAPKLNIPRPLLETFCHKWKVKELSLFGSALRDDFRPDSDIDVLVELQPNHGLSLYDWVDMIDELKSIFGRDVDLVSKGGLRNPIRRAVILRTAQCSTMRPDDADRSYLLDMFKHAQGAVASVRGKRLESYVADETLRLSIERRVRDHRRSGSRSIRTIQGSTSRSPLAVAKSSRKRFTCLHMSMARFRILPSTRRRDIAFAGSDPTNRRNARRQTVIPDAALLDRAARIIRDGGVVAFPTETVYGLGANALDAIAVAKIFEIKGRPRFDPLIVHVAQVNEVAATCRDMARGGEAACGAVLAWAVDDCVSEGGGGAGHRDGGAALGGRAGAGSCGGVGVDPTRPGCSIAEPAECESVWGNQPDDGRARAAGVGRCGGGDPGWRAVSARRRIDGGFAGRFLASSVSSVARPGATPVEEIEAVIGATGPADEARPGEAALAPGMLERHYLPRTKIVLRGTKAGSTGVEEYPGLFEGLRAGLGGLDW